MKRAQLIFVLSFVLLLMNCSKKQQYVIRGSLGTLNAPATVYLLEIQDQAYVVKDSAILENGKFTFEGEIDTLSQVSLTLNNEGTGYQLSPERKQLFLENGVITVQDSNGSLREAVVSGTPNNDAKALYEKEVGLPLQEALAALQKKQQEATPELLEQETFTAELTEMEQQFNAQVIKLVSDFVQAHPNVFVSLQQLAMNLVGIADNAHVESLYNGLSTELKQSPIGQDVAAKLARLKLFKVGEVMPDLTLPDTSGNPISPSDFKGQYLLIDLWAAWCAPCRAENPNLVAMYNKYQSKNFNILGVSLDDSRAEWLAAIHKDGLAWPQVSDLKLWTSKAVEHFGIASIPTNYLIDPTGKIIARDLRGQALRNKLDELLEKGT